MDIDPPRPPSDPSNPPQHAPLDPPRRTLVLDLDETLIHTALGTAQECWVTHQRPFAVEFLQRMSQYYEIVIFTAGLENYAGPVIDALDRHGTVTHRLYRGSCAIMSGTDKRPLYAKDLMLLGRDLARTIIVDNSPESYFLQPENAVPIKPFFGDVQDHELHTLAEFLTHLVDVDVSDVRTVIRKCHERGKFRARKSDGGSCGNCKSSNGEMMTAGHVVDDDVDGHVGKHHVDADSVTEDQKHVTRSNNNNNNNNNSNSNNNDNENQVFHSDTNASSHYSTNSQPSMTHGAHTSTQMSTSPASPPPRTTPAKPHMHTNIECTPGPATQSTTHASTSPRTTPSDKTHAQTHPANNTPASSIPAHVNKPASAKAASSSVAVYAVQNIMAGTKPSGLAGKTNFRSHTSGMNATSSSLMQVLVTGLAGNRGGTDDGANINAVGASTSHDDGTLNACITFLDAARRALVREGDAAVYSGISRLSTIEPSTVVSTTATILLSPPQAASMTSAQTATSTQASPNTAPSVLWTPRRELNLQRSNVTMTEFATAETGNRLHAYTLPYIQCLPKARTLSEEGYGTTKFASDADRNGHSHATSDGQNRQRMSLLLSKHGNVSRLKNGYNINQKERMMYDQPDSSRTEADLFESAHTWRGDERVQNVGGARLENTHENNGDITAEKMPLMRVEPYTYAAAARLGLRGSARQVSFSVL
jgi:Dullard-like phosphatase family protein